MMRKKKTKYHTDEHIDETWLVPYADLLTLLLALFIVLFASSVIDEGKLNSISRSFNIAFNNGLGFFKGSSYIELPEDISNIKEKDSNIRDRSKDVDENDVKSYLSQMIEQETRQLEELKSKLDSYIQENGLASELETTLNSRQLLITFRDSALFDSASADLKPEAERLARTIGEMLAQYPEYEIMVSGHTDNVPINTARFPSNWELSAMRALNFMKILLESDISPERVSSVGYGEYRPIATNDTVEGKAANRRVEVSIVRNFLEQALDEDYLLNQ
jgi:chemotaxis protein MotB